MSCCSEYALAREWILNNMSLTRDVEVQLFEITIRALGGLLSIYHLTQDEAFLTAAVSSLSRYVQSLSPHVIRRHNVNCFFVVLWVMLATKLTKFGSIYLGEGLSEWDEISQVARGVGVPHYPDW